MSIKSKILCFDKPKQIRNFGEGSSFDGGPIDGYEKNYSYEDQKKFLAKHINKGKDSERIEIRTTLWSDLVVIVSKDMSQLPGCPFGQSWKDKNVKISANGPFLMTFQELDNLHAAIEEAKNIIGV